MIVNIHRFDFRARERLKWVRSARLSPITFSVSRIFPNEVVLIFMGTAYNICDLKKIKMNVDWTFNKKRIDNYI